MRIAQFIEDNIKVRGSPVKLYDYQKKLLEDQSDFRIINKSRQIGISWIIAMEALFYALARPSELILIVSVSHKAAKDVMSYIDSAYESLPASMRLPLKVDTKEEKMWSNGSRVLSLANNYRTVRGKAATRVYLDEYAHFGNEDVKMWESLMPSITRGGKATIISTPLGKSGKFHEFWEDAPKMKWSVHEIDYKQCPDIMSRIEVIKQGLPDELSFRQEYCCEFVDEATSYFPMDLIKSCIDPELEVNVEVETDNPIYFGIDFGKKIDSTIIIGVVKTGEHFKLMHIMEFKPPSILSDASSYVIRNHKRWKVSKIAIDQTGMGERMIEDFADLGNIVTGVNFTQPLKDRMISNLRILMQDRKIKIPDHPMLLAQLHALRKIVTATSIRYAHPDSGKVQHDDYVWALALAVYEGISDSPGGSILSFDGLVNYEPSERDGYNQGMVY